MIISYTSNDRVNIWHDGDYDTLTLKIDGETKTYEEFPPLIQAIAKLCTYEIKDGSTKDLRWSWFCVYLKYLIDASNRN